jgi:hypothetical protein
METQDAFRQPQIPVRPYGLGARHGSILQFANLCFSVWLAESMRAADQDDPSRFGGIEHGRGGTMLQIAMDAGLGDPKALDTNFWKARGTAPKDFRESHNLVV